MELDFSNLEPTMWINTLPEYQASTVSLMLGSDMGYEEVAIHLLTQVGPENTAPFGPKSAQTNYFGAVKDEFGKLICGDETYDELRAQVGALWDKNKGPVALAVASAIGSQIGIAAAVLVPVIVLLLAMVTQIGRNAWCALREKQRQEAETE